MTTHKAAEETIDVAFVFGAHPFDVPAMKDVWDALPGMRIFPQDLPTFARDVDDVRSRYDVAVLYNFHEHDLGGSPRPVQLSADAYEMAIDAIRDLGEEGTGIVVLHHGIAAFPDSDEWERMSGIDGRSLEGVHMDEQFQVDIADPDHRITAQLSPFDFRDELYVMDEPTDDSRVLLSAEDAPGMDALAWVREYRNSRVFAYQSGHDATVFSTPEFRTILARGIRWAVDAPEIGIRVD